jgi:DNA-binding HxlR family transcriptional regulator
MILRQTKPEYNQNMVVQALVDLEKRGLVERTTSKAWVAKASASSYLED